MKFKLSTIYNPRQFAEIRTKKNREFQGILRNKDLIDDRMPRGGPACQDNWRDGNKCRQDEQLNELIQNEEGSSGSLLDEDINEAEIEAENRENCANELPVCDFSALTE